MKLLKVLSLPVIAFILQACPESEKEEVVPEIIQSASIVESTINYNELEVKYNFENLQESNREYGICFANRNYSSLASIDDSTRYFSNKTGGVVLENLSNDTEYSIRPFVKTTTGVIYGEEIKQNTKGLVGSTWIFTSILKGDTLIGEVRFTGYQEAVFNGLQGNLRSLFSIMRNEEFVLNVNYESGVILSYPGIIRDEDNMDFDAAWNFYSRQFHTWFAVRK